MITGGQGGHGGQGGQGGHGGHGGHGGMQSGSGSGFGGNRHCPSVFRFVPPQLLMILPSADIGNSQFTTNLGLIRLTLALNWNKISGEIPLMLQGRLRLRTAKLLVAPSTGVLGSSGALDIFAQKRQILPLVFTVPSKT